jgi:biotin carboxylase
MKRALREWRSREYQRRLAFIKILETPEFLAVEVYTDFVEQVMMPR